MYPYTNRIAYLISKGGYTYHPSFNLFGFSLIHPLIFARMKTDPAIFEEAKALIDKAEKVVITNHLNPDGDAVGSALGLYHVIKKLGKEVQVVVPNDYPSFLKWMEGSDKVLRHEEEPEKSEEALRDADLIIHLDYNALARSGHLKKILKGHPAKKIVIDHHQQPEDFADVLYSDPKMSSTCEMLYHFLEATGLKSHLDQSAAEALYTGLITDTGNFRFSSTTSETHRVAGELLQLGVQPSLIASRVYDSNRPSRLKLLSRALDRMEVIQDAAAAIIYLTAKDLEELDYHKGDTEGIVNYGLSLAGIELSVFIYPKGGDVKMSFRSKTDFDVNQFARTHFNGGGHLNAAGGVSELSLEETLDKVKKVLPQYADQLQSI